MKRAALVSLSGKKSTVRNDHREQELREKISRLWAVISEITEENLQLKKRLGTESGETEFVRAEGGHSG